MDQQQVQYPARSVDIRITAPDCGDYRFSAAVADTLEAVVKSLREVSYQASPFESEAGRIEIEPEHEWQPKVIVEWSAAKVQPPEAGPLPDAPEAMPDAEVLADLTPEERDALGVWAAFRTPKGWKVVNGAHTIFVGGTDLSLDDAKPIMIETMRQAEIIGPNDTPVFEIAEEKENA